jgi:hypothetical protein
VALDTLTTGGDTGTSLQYGGGILSEDKRRRPSFNGLAARIINQPAAYAGCVLKHTFLGNTTKKK